VFAIVATLSACNALFDIDEPILAAAGAAGAGASGGGDGGTGGVGASGGTSGVGGASGGASGGTAGKGGATGGAAGGNATGGRGGSQGGKGGDIGEGGAADTGATGGDPPTTGGSAGNSAAGVGGSDAGTAGMGGVAGAGGTSGTGGMADPCVHPSFRGAELVPIPGGQGIIGADDINANTLPVIMPTFSDFCMDRTEATVSDYAECMADDVCTAQGSAAGCNRDLQTRADHPVTCITQSQAALFCAWANKRLPTEKEWEYAARGPTGRKYPWGPGDPNSGLLNYNSTINETTPVGNYVGGATPDTGLLDMAGNVWEWTASTWCEDYNAGATCDVTKGVARGGSFASNQPEFVRPSWRDPDNAGDHRFGLRCAAGAGNNP
jgi:formylglycine-generating enzyme required for sulfatase activity